MQTRMQMEMQKKQSRIHIKLVLCLAVVILIFIAMTGFAAGETRTGTVATTALNLRSGP